jgi:hypothetical protein
VVADEHDVAVATAERTHAVVATGQCRPVVQHDRELGVVEGAVLEVLRQPEPYHPVAQVRYRAEFANTRSIVVGERRTGDKAGKRSTDHGATRHGGGALEDAASIEFDHRVSLGSTIGSLYARGHAGHIGRSSRIRGRR